MSGAINYGLIDDVGRVVDADVRQETVNLEHYDQVHLTALYNKVLNMDREEIVCVTAAAVNKYPFEVYRTLALYAERGK